MSTTRFLLVYLLGFLVAVWLIWGVFTLTSQHNEWERAKIDACAAAGGVWLQTTEVGGCYRSLAVK